MNVGTNHNNDQRKQLKDNTSSIDKSSIESSIALFERLFDNKYLSKEIVIDYKI